MKSVIYHKNCTDGWCAASVLAHKFNKELDNGEIEFIPGEYNKEEYYINMDWKDKEVYIVDFGFSEKTLLKIAENAKSVVMLDHHKTMWEEFVDDSQKSETYLNKNISHNCQVVIDLNKSGSLLTWSFFFSEPAPKVVQHVSDGDLYKFELEGTKGFLNYVSLQEQNLESYIKLLKLTPEEELNIKNNSSMLEKLYEAICQDFAKKYKNIEFDLKDSEGNIIATHVGGFIACPGDIKSRVGEIIYDKTKTFALILTDISDSHYRISLRASNINKYNVRTIAEHFGGGGHDAAAAFTVSKEEWDNNCRITELQQNINKTRKI